MMNFTAAIRSPRPAAPCPPSAPMDRAALTEITQFSMKIKRNQEKSREIERNHPVFNERIFTFYHQNLHFMYKSSPASPADPSADPGQRDGGSGPIPSSSSEELSANKGKWSQKQSKFEEDGEKSRRE